MVRAASAVLALLLALACPTGGAEAAAPGPPSVAGYGRGDPACRAWTDGCTICEADPGAAARCSTPGIACTPRAIACEAPPPLSGGGTGDPR